MKLSFDIHTTSCKPLLISIDHDKEMSELLNCIIYELESYTMISEEDIRDIYICNKSNICSLFNNKCTVQEFITNNYEDKSHDKTKSTLKVYNIYVIDDIYLYRLANNKPAPVYNNDVIPQPKKSLIENIKKGIISMLYI